MLILFIFLIHVLCSLFRFCVKRLWYFLLFVLYECSVLILLLLSVFIIITVVVTVIIFQLFRSETAFVFVEVFFNFFLGLWPPGSALIMHMFHSNHYFSQFAILQWNFRWLKAIVCILMTSSGVNLHKFKEH